MLTVLGIKPVRIPRLKLVHVHLENGLQIIANGISADSQIPGNVAELLSHVLPVKFVALKEHLFMMSMASPASPFSPIRPSSTRIYGMGSVVMRDSVRNARAWYSLIVIVGCSFLHVVGVFSYGCFLASS